MPSPDDLRRAAKARIPEFEQPEVLGRPARRKAVTRSFASIRPDDGITVTADHTIGSSGYSVANVTSGEPLGASYTQVSVKLPDPWGDDIAEAIADGVAPTISGVAREWMNVGRAQWRESKTTTNTTTEGNTTT